MYFEDQEDFVQALKEPVVRVCEEYNLFPSVCMAQACIESSYGKQIIGEYNCFGMKYCGEGESLDIQTEEENEDGTRSTIIAKFQGYTSFDEAVEGYCKDLVENQAYSTAIAQVANGRNAFIDSFTSVYATDSEYAKLIKDVIADWGFDELDC